MEARPVPRKLSPSLTQPKRFKSTLRSNSSTPSPNPLFALHSFLRELFPGLPPLEAHTASTAISAEIKAVVLTLAKARYAANASHKQAVKKDMTRLEAIKTALKSEEADIEGKMQRVEGRMREVLLLHSAVRDKEKGVKEDKARIGKLAKALSRREAVLEAFACSLDEEKQRLEVEKAAFVASKEEWMSVHPSPPSPPAYRTPLDSAPASCDSPVFPH